MDDVMSQWKKKGQKRDFADGYGLHLRNLRPVPSVQTTLVVVPVQEQVLYILPLFWTWLKLNLKM